MTGIVVEGGIYFLLLFAPFAFGGVELWAVGVIQMVAGVVVAAWVLGARRDPAAGLAHPSPLALRALWTSIALFLLLVGFQLVPMPPGWIRALSPDTHSLYASTLPGYERKEPFDPGRLPAWLLEQEREGLPARPVSPAPDEPDPIHPPLPAPTAAAPVSPLRTLSLNTHQTWNRLSQLLCYVGLFAVVGGYYRTPERLRRLMSAVVFAGFAVSFFGILQRLTWNGRLYWIREGSYNNPFGPFVNRNSYAAFAGTVLPIAVCAALGFLRQWEKGTPGALPRLALWGFASVTMTGGVFYSLSRGGILSAALSFALVAALLLYYDRGGRELLVLGAIGLTAALFLFWIGPEKVIERVGTLSEGQSIPSMTSRIGAWERAVGLIERNLVVGTGLGTFAFAFMRLSPPGEAWWDRAHNEYLELACDTGLTGALLFVAGLAAWLALVARPGRFRSRSERYVYMGIVAGIAGMMLHSLVSSNFQVPANGTLITILAGALMGLVASQGSTGQRRRSRGDSSRAARSGDTP